VAEGRDNGNNESTTVQFERRKQMQNRAVGGATDEKEWGKALQI
jgi:hypothetical protein